MTEIRPDINWHDAVRAYVLTVVTVLEAVAIRGKNKKKHKPKTNTIRFPVPPDSVLQFLPCLLS